MVAVLLLIAGVQGTAHAQLSPADADLTGVVGGAVAWGDVDGDGDPDLLLLGNKTGAVESIDDADPSTTLYENEGDGTFSSMDADLTDVSAGAAAFGDYDRDGDLDLVVTGIEVGGLVPIPEKSATIYENDGTGTFTALSADIDGVTVGAVDWGDVDDDGDLDLLVSGNTGGIGQEPLPDDPDPTTTIYENKGNGTFSPLGADVAGASVGASAFGDIDNDGDPDLVVTGGQGTSLDNPEPISVLYENDGTGTFTKRDEGLTDVAGGSVTWTDVDGDRALDLILTGGTAAEEVTTELYRNDGSGSFSPASTDLEDVAGGAVAANDVDADGDPDLVVSGRNSEGAPVAVAYENDGTGAFRPFGVDLTAVEGGAADWGDANRDGHADLALVGRDADSVATATYYENLTEPSHLIAYSARDVDGDGTVRFVDTGVNVRFSETNGSGTVAIEKFATAPSQAHGIAESTVSDYRFVVRTGGALTAGSGTEMHLDVERLAGVDDPGQVVVYGRTVEGEEQFTKRETTVESDRLVAPVGSFSEFVLASDTEPLDGPADPLPVPTTLALETADGPASELTWRHAQASSIERYRIYRDTAPYTTGPAGHTPIDSVGADTASYTDESVPPGYTYYYRVTAVDSAGRESRFSDGASAFFYPSTVAATVARSFGDASGPDDYRLVALPGQVDRPLSATLSGEGGSEWQAFFDDGSSEDFLVRYDESDPFRFRPGTGFWLTARTDWTVEEELSTVALTGDSAAIVPLREGWNIVSNPTGKPVATDRVRAANRGAADSTLQPLWAFNGSFQQADTMHSAARGVAYYFLNDQGLDSLRVPYPGAPRRRAPAKATPSASAAEARSVLAVTARRRGKASGPASTVQVGWVDDEAARTVVAPPAQFEAVSLQIEASADAPRRQRFLKTALRSKSEEEAAFPLRLRTQNGGPVHLRVTRALALDGRTAVLVDSSTHNRYTLRSGNSVTLRPDEPTTRLTLLVGSERYVDEQTEGLLPDEMRLTSYPNPMRRQGTVAYTLPQEVDVTLRLYDVLGREVATLVEGTRQAGRHDVQFDPAALSSGVYVGRLRAGGQTQTRKIMIVR